MESRLPIPRRTGLDLARWNRLFTAHDRERERALSAIGEPNELGGRAYIWYRHAGRVVAVPLGIQPGIVDDLPSLASTLTVEIGWPGAEAPAGPGGPAPEEAVGWWARVWQVREQADLRLTLYWTAEGALHGAATLGPRDGGPRKSLMDIETLVALLFRVAMTPVSSESPHGLILAANRAMRDEESATARTLYERALVYLPAHAEAWHNLALAHARLEEWEPAAEAMERALALAPDAPDVGQEYLALETDAGIRAVQANDPERAADHFLRILRRWPTEPTALANLGNLRLRQGRPREARAIFERFLRAHPTHAAAETVRLALKEMGGGE